MKAYSVDLRQKIVGAYEAGNISIRKVTKLFQVSKSTVQGLLKQKKEKGTIAPRTATGGNLAS
ncbi:IS630 transposase-related protein [Nostoc sp. NMS4]|uniref:IS630 transposase-related protein n=1 Tax=Nostoc sp. NMS4 TaxID=2815390 RepID=UPI0025F77442|nr:IS630 transposase-related protein [Nostoc sp. NMS4]MBN3924780.1 transposase [Nostoc sp. NMS4]